MTDQSGLQGFIQKMQGTHTQGQANTPSSVNNGNPNTVYNWSSYKPTVSSGPTGLPSVNFDLITSQAPASSPGYATPFTADPYAAMVLAGIPRASSANSVNHLLGSMFGGGNGGGTFTPNPSTGAPVTTPTPVSPGTSYTPPAGSSRGGGRPVGPISGPIASNPHNWQANYANANNNSMNAGGRTTALPWTAAPPSQQGPTGDTGVDTGRNVLTGLWDTLSGLAGRASESIANDFRDTFGDLSGDRGGLAALRAALNVLQPGAGELVPRGANEPVLTDRELQAITDKANNTLNSMLETIRNNSPLTQQAITAKLNETLMNSIQRGYDANRQDPQAIYNAAPQHSARDWQRLQEQFNFARMFQEGRAGDIGQELGRQAEQKTREFIARRGNVLK